MAFPVISLSRNPAANQAFFLVSVSFHPPASILPYPCEKARLSPDSFDKLTARTFNCPGCLPRRAHMRLPGEYRSASFVTTGFIHFGVLRHRSLADSQNCCDLVILSVYAASGAAMLLLATIPPCRSYFQLQQGSWIP